MRSSDSYRKRLRISLREAVKPDWLMLNDELLQSRGMRGKVVELKLYCCNKQYKMYNII